MKLTKIVKAALGLTLSLVIFAGCSAAPAPAETPAEAPAARMVVDKDKKEIRMETEVNAKYFTEPTRHGVVFKDGSNGEKSVLRGLADQFEFHQALVDIGMEPGNNLALEDMKKSKKVEGDQLDVFVTWDGLGKEIPFEDIIKSSDPRPMDIRFGGNLENATAKKTGCVLCLDSCAVGITSNSSYATGESDNVQFYGNSEVLPEDGTIVTVIFRPHSS